MRIHDIRRQLGVLAIGAALHAIAACPVLAGTSAPGFNLRWDQCYADGGAWNKNFACDTNSGTDRLVVSFELDSPLDSLSGIETRMTLAAASPVLPVWWQLRAGGCRGTALSYGSLPPAGSSACLDWGSGQSGGGVGTYTIGTGLPGGEEANEARMIIASGVPSSAIASIASGQEYFAFSLGISHTKTVGTNACGGCQTPVAIYIASMTLVTPRATEERHLGRGANYEGSAYAS